MLNPWKDRKQDAGPETEEDIDEAAGGSTDEGETPAEAGGSDESADAPAEEGADLEAELAELKDRYLRLAAEFENFRKRTRKEASTGRGLAQAELL
ncbi:MAG: nucleotide exchange factor GrpE, partial [Gemmatimonadota bacterium]